MIKPVMLISFVLQSISCQFNGEQINKSNLSCEIKLAKDSIQFPLDTYPGGKYFFSQNTLLDGKKVIVTYNDQNSNVDILDFSDKKLLKTFTLFPDPNLKLSPVTGFYFHNLDSIFLMTNTKLALLNSTGAFHFNKWINVRRNDAVEGIDPDKLVFYNTPENGCPLYFDQKENAVYIATKALSNRMDPLYYDYPLAGKINLSNFRYEPLPIYFLDEFKEEGFFPMDKPFITFQSGNIVYGFPITPDIFVFDKGSSKITRYKQLLKNSSGSVEPLPLGAFGDEQSIMRHVSLNPSYHRIIPGDSYYFRFHMASFEEDLKGRLGIRGPVWLTVYDDAFQLLIETKVSDVSMIGSVGYNGGLLTWLRNPPNENALHYAILQVHCPDAATGMLYPDHLPGSMQGNQPPE